MNKFHEYTILSGDSLTMIAQRMLGDSTRAMELAAINNLNYPFIVSIQEETSEGVKKPGDTISIPMDILDQDTVELPLYEDPFGSDLLLSTDKVNLSYGKGGEFKTNMYGDLVTVSGIATLEQDLIHQLVTDIGTMPHHPTYGSEFLRIIGNKKDFTWRHKAVIEVSRTFLSDYRVSDVRDIEVRDIPTGVAMSCTIVTVSSNVSIKTTIESEV